MKLKLKSKRSRDDVRLRKTLLLIVCSVFLLMLSALRVDASISLRNHKVKINVTQSSLKNILISIRNQSGIDFVYSENQIEDVQNLTINKEGYLDEVLQSCLVGTNLTYAVEDDLIIIKMKSQSLQQEEIVIKGRVTDKKKEPIPGANVILFGYNTGTITDFDGYFTLKVADEQGELQVSFIGFDTQNVKYIKGQELKIVMIETVTSIDEVQVVAYGETTRREMTGSVASVKGEDLKNIPSTNIANLLQGRVAGMDVTNISGSPGAGGTSITIRGYNSISAGLDEVSRFSNPLWVIDGVPLNSFNSPVTGTNLLADINPEMIESIEVLKDASAAVLYGSRAANGVILVTTKSGKKNQKAKISVNVSQSYSILPKLPTITIGKGERDFRLSAIKAGGQLAYLDPTTMTWVIPQSLQEAYENRYSTGVYDVFWMPNPHTEAPKGTELILQDSLNTFYNNQVNPFKEYYQKGKVTNANVQMYGGLEKMSYGLGVGVYSETGILKGTGFNRLDLNGNMKIKPFEKFDVDFRFGASFNERNRKTGASRKSFTSAPAIETVPGEPYKISSLLPGPGSPSWERVIAGLNGIDEKNRNIRLRSNVKASYQLSEGLTFTTNGAVDFAYARQNAFTPSTLDWNGWSKSNGSIGTNIMLLNENLLSFKKSINDIHNFNSLAGLSYQYDQVEYIGGYGLNSPSDDIKYVTNAFPKYEIITDNDQITVNDFQTYRSNMTEKSMISVFGRLEYNYLKKYLISASLRNDGVSVFGANNKWALFPAFSAGWSFSEENFMDNLSHIITFGKLRASWGKSGRQFDRPYLAYGVLNAGSPFNGNPTIAPDWEMGLYNKNLSWEETTQFDVGFDLDMFNYKLSLTGDYYLRNTTGLLYPVDLPGASTYTSYLQQWQNAASVSNAGVEILLKWKAIQKDDFALEIMFNAAKNWNRFDDSYNGRDLDPLALIIGKPLNGIYGHKTDGFIDDASEIPSFGSPYGETRYVGMGDYTDFYHIGDRKIVDVNGDNVIDDKDRVFLGSAVPEVFGGINTTMTYKQFDLTANFTYQIGRHIINARKYQSVLTRSTAEDMLKPLMVDLNDISFWTNPGDTDVDFERLASASNRRYYPWLDTNVERVNWIKLKTIVLGYSLSEDLCKKIGLEGVRTFISAENLFTLTNYSGDDPETVDISNGFDTGLNYPLARKFTLGLTVKF